MKDGMSILLHPYRSLRWHMRALALLFYFIVAVKAHAAQLDFHAYGKADGLSDLNDSCVSQANNGYILICSEHGLFIYDGRRFINLGLAQGLREGGVIFDLVQSPDGRLFLRYSNGLYVSRQPFTSSLTPRTMSFEKVDIGKSLFNENCFQMAIWSGGLAIIDRGRILNVPIRKDQQLDVKPGDFFDNELNALKNPTGVRSIRDELWITLEDGRICSAMLKSTECYGRDDGLPGVSWHDVEAGVAGLVVARSDNLLATLNPVTRRVTLETLPGQEGWSASVRRYLGIFHDPYGRLMTQSTTGLIVKDEQLWRQLPLAGNVPPGSITSAMTDRAGTLWIGTYDSGVTRAVAYGKWDNINQADGLSDHIVWGTVRVPHGSFWVATDKAVDEIAKVNGHLTTLRAIPGSSYAIAVAATGAVWAGNGTSGIRRIDPKTGRVVALPLPPVNAIAALGHRLWIGTEKGLFFVDDVSGSRLEASRASLDDSKITALVSDESGGLWFLSDGQLFHRSVTGETTIAVSRWPAGEFEPLCLSKGFNSLWVGGAGGLYKLTLLKNTISSIGHFGSSATMQNTVVAVRVDRRGWVWTGTSSGISVFNGQRWVSVDTSAGLIWDDINQNGIAEDSDSSIWISTGNGLTHLLKPESLFDNVPPDTLVSDIQLDNKPMPNGTQPYTAGPLSVQLGTSSYAAENSIVFRYKMLGVDQYWVETATGAIHYPFVPPGRHWLAVESYNLLTHLSSKPATLMIVMAYPWWRQWWAEAGYLILSTGILYALWQIRVRSLIGRQRELEQIVDDRTREIQLAQQRLLIQATRDGLTELLNRAAVERRLAQDLSNSVLQHQIGIALLDVDHFKRINDKYGHLGGDQVLKQVGARIQTFLQAGSYAGRYGGEEFLVVIDNRDGDGLHQISRFHSKLSNEAFLVDGHAISVTCSIGLAWARPDDHWESLVGRADRALYGAKHQGRNRVVEEASIQEDNEVRRGR